MDGIGEFTYIPTGRGRTICILYNQQNLWLVIWDGLPVCQPQMRKLSPNSQYKDTTGYWDKISPSIMSLDLPGFDLKQGLQDVCQETSCDMRCSFIFITSNAVRSWQGGKHGEHSYWSWCNSYTVTQVAKYENVDKIACTAFNVRTKVFWSFGPVTTDAVDSHVEAMVNGKKQIENRSWKIPMGWWLGRMAYDRQTQSYTHVFAYLLVVFEACHVWNVREFAPAYMSNKLRLACRGRSFFDVFCFASFSASRYALHVGGRPLAVLGEDWLRRKLCSNHSVDPQCLKWHVLQHLTRMPLHDVSWDFWRWNDGTLFICWYFLVFLDMYCITVCYVMIWYMIYDICYMIWYLIWYMIFYLWYMICVFCSPPRAPGHAGHAPRMEEAWPDAPPEDSLPSSCIGGLHCLRKALLKLAEHVLFKHVDICGFKMVQSCSKTEWSKV